MECQIGQILTPGLPAPFWSIVRRGCHPDSLARTTDLQKSFADPPDINSKNAEPHLYKGYVSNHSLAAELCHQPDLQGLEGILIQPLTISATKTLFPMFGGSKLTVNNEILIPAAMYWPEEERFSGSHGQHAPWQGKLDGVIWRGVATGGKNFPENWRGFQRHRFVAMNNATTLNRAQADNHKPENFALAEEQYDVVAQKEGNLGEWVSSWANVGLTDPFCTPWEGGTCSYTDHYFHRVKGVKLAKQFSFKFLPDIDGNSFSGRYLAFLRSTSLPIKATIWREWHDSRLVAWKHFVPMDSRFIDYYGIMQYFLGYDEKVADHDQVAQKIASEGRDWARRVLRKEDMLIYVWRLLLEYGRVMDDKREKLGWVDDLLKQPPSKEAS